MTAESAGARTSRGAATRSTILDATHELLSSRGLEETTIVEISKAAKVGVGTVYLHFVNKDGLLLALVDRALAVRSNMIDEAGAAPAASKVRLIGALYLDLATADPVAFRVMIATMLEPKAGTALDQVSHASVAKFAEVVDELGGELEDLHGAASAPTVYALLLASWTGLGTMLTRRDGSAVSPSVAADALALTERIALLSPRPG